MDIAITAPLAAGNRAAECGRAIFHSLLTSKLAVEMLDSATLVPSAAPVQLLCLEAGQLATVLPAWCSQLPPDALRIVVPLWDFARFPQAALAALALAHEVWAPSRFIQGALAGQLDCPVLHMPVAADATPASSTHHALPGGRFRFLSLVGAQPVEDCRAAMDAFRRAFPQRGRTCLVLASQEPLAIKQRAELAEAADADPDILLLDQPLGTVACDALVALQSSEGVARPVVAAMLLERPVIAIGYAANGEFVTRQTGYPVDYSLAAVPDHSNQAAVSQLCAEPDVAHAAWLMRRLQQEPAAARPLTAHAQASIQGNHNAPHVARLYQARLHTLGLPQ